MKSSNSWLEFSWKLQPDLLPETVFELGALKLADVEIGEPLFQLLGKAVSMDNSLGEVGRILRDFFWKHASQVWSGLEPQAIAVFHGERMVGASVVAFSAGTKPGLLSGPCVLGEYCSRGLGTILLQESLCKLRRSGAEAARGVCGAHGVLAKYIYPKFGGMATPCEIDDPAEFWLEPREA